MGCNVGSGSPHRERIATDCAIRGVGCKRGFAPIGPVCAVHPPPLHFVAAGGISSAFCPPAGRAPAGCADWDERTAVGGGMLPAYTARSPLPRPGGPMAEPKTRATGADVNAFLAAVADPQRRADCQTVATLMQKVVGEPPVIWGTNIVGFGRYRYVYASGRSGDWPLTGFSPRAAALTLYVMTGFEGEAALMQRLGKYRTGKSCLYVKRLADVDIKVLEDLLRRSVADLRQKYPTQ
jgi:hypothetical protein